MGGRGGHTFLSCFILLTGNFLCFFLCWNAYAIPETLQMATLKGLKTTMLVSKRKRPLLCKRYTSVLQKCDFTSSRNRQEGSPTSAFFLSLSTCNLLSQTMIHVWGSVMCGLGAGLAVSYFCISPAVWHGQETLAVFAGTNPFLIFSRNPGNQSNGRKMGWGTMSFIDSGINLVLENPGSIS